MSVMFYALLSFCISLTISHTIRESDLHPESKHAGTKCLKRTKIIWIHAKLWYSLDSELSPLRNQYPFKDPSKGRLAMWTSFFKNPPVFLLLTHTLPWICPIWVRNLEANRKPPTNG